MRKVAYTRNRTANPTARRFASAPVSYRRTLSSVLAVATILAMPVTKARAQAFAGSITNATDQGGGLFQGSGFNVTRSSGLDEVRIEGPTAVINWRPNDTNAGGGSSDPIQFLPGGNQVIFQNDEALNPDANYTVLNRILPTDSAVGRPIGFYGDILARVVDDENSAISGAGGRVWFYSPGGLLIGSGATFDVGGLLLTTGDPAAGSGGTSIDPNAFIPMNSGAGATNGVIIQNGALIRAAATGALNTSGSYVAVVSPIIQQNSVLAGSPGAATSGVVVNGSAAYVAAENATMRINDGLFDIQVSVGSDTALQHTGSTVWENGNSATINRRIYLVAVPRNTALTTLLGGSTPADLGFDEAVDAVRAADGTVVLSAGRNISSLALDSVGARSTSTQNSTIDVTDDRYTDIRANLVLAAANSADVTASSSQSYLAGLGVNGIDSAGVTASGSGATLAVGGDLVVSASRFALPTDTSVTGGTAILTADTGGLITVGGNASVIASASGCSSSNLSCITQGGTDYKFVTTTGGEASVLVNDAEIDITGSLAVFAKTVGQSDLGTPSTPYAAVVQTGGSADVFVNGTGELTVGGNLDMQAIGNAQLGRGTGSAGTGIGGDVDLGVNGTGVITIQGAVELVADGFGADGFGGNASNGVGGSVSISSNNEGSTLNFNGEFKAIADGEGGNSSANNGTGGIGTGGIVDLVARDLSTLKLEESIELRADGIGGNGTGSGGIGGVGRGGTISFSAAGGVLNATSTEDTFLLQARARGGYGVATGGNAANTLTSPFYGNVNIFADEDGEVNIGRGVNLDARAVAGTGGTNSGNAQAGQINVFTGFGGNGAITIAGDVVADASAFIGVEGTTTGGNATGGQVFLRSFGGGTLSAAGVDGRADGLGGDRTSGTAGNGTGGRFEITAEDSSTMSFTSVEGSVDGEGGDNGTGTGGNGTGGEINFFASGSDAAITIFDNTLGGDFETLNLHANATGGNGDAGGGNAIGGTIRVGVMEDGGTINLSNAVLEASAQGGFSNSGAGGTAAGGNVRFFADAGEINNIDTLAASGFLDMIADQVGGDGFTTGGTALAVHSGTTRGRVEIFAADGIINIDGSVDLSSKASAGDGSFTGSGNHALGGVARISVGGPGEINIGSNVDLDVSSEIDNFFSSERGGNATGGQIDIVATGSGLINIGGDVLAFAGGEGGNAIQGSTPNAGFGQGGGLFLNAGGTTTIDITGTVTGFLGGEGGYSENTNGIGGEGRGGNANIGAADSGTLLVGNQDSQGSGTGLDIMGDGEGGNGRVTGGQGLGGNLILQVNSDTAAVAVGAVTFSVNGEGGDAGGLSTVGATGGYGRGGLASIRAIQGDISVSGNVSLQSNGDGGSGNIGGTGQGGAPDYTDFMPFFGASAIAQSGALDIGGTLFLGAEGYGGNSTVGSNGLVGRAGDGLGGYAEFQALVDTSNPTESNISANAVTLSVTGLGGSASSSSEGGLPFGGAGGRGGDGKGGQAGVGGAVSVGNIDVNSVNVRAYAFGGSGSSGYDNSSATSLVNGGVGGAGGNAIGGSVSIGIFSGPAVTGPSTGVGSASYGAITVDATAAGGIGGAGAAGVNSGTNGNGGAGGNAEGGSAAILARGGSVQIATVDANVSAIGATGGAAGGTGANGGAGGNGFGGGFAVISSYRFNGDTSQNFTPLSTGDMSINSVTANISGNSEGGGLTEPGDLDIYVAGGDLTIGSTTIVANGTIAGDEGPNIYAANGTLIFGSGSGNALTITTDDTANVVSLVNFFEDAGGTITFNGACLVDGDPCMPPGLRPSPPPPPPPPPVEPSPPPVSPPPPVDPSPPPPPPVEPPPPPPVEPPPPPPVEPPPPPPPAEVPVVMEVIQQETTNITSSIQASLTGARVAGGSIGASSTPTTSPPPPPTAVADSGGSGSGSSGEGGSADGATAAADDGGEDSPGNESGDEDEGASADSSGSVANPSLLVDTTTVGGSNQQIDTPIISSGNSSLWLGADGLADIGDIGGTGGGDAGGGGTRSDSGSGGDAGAGTAAGAGGAAGAGAGGGAGSATGDGVEGSGGNP